MLTGRDDAEILLTLWEAALGQTAGARDEALLGVAFAGEEPARTLGERNSRLVELHARLFGRAIELASRCAECGTAVEFSADAEALRSELRPRLDEVPPYRLVAEGHEIEFRLPDGADLAIAAGEEAEEVFARRLLDRCIVACARGGERVAVGQLPAPVLTALSQRMEALDPGASVAFSLACPRCTSSWQAPLAVGEMLWQKVRVAAEHLLLDVDALARTYGWTEGEVLGLSPLRRAAYLQLVTE